MASNEIDLKILVVVICSFFFSEIDKHDFRSNWVGLNSKDGGVTWAWTDGSPVDYLQWYPNPPTITTGHICALIDFNSNNIESAGYEAYNCSSPLFQVICKKPL